MGSAAGDDFSIPGSLAVARRADDGASVEVRCAACGRLLFKLDRTAGVAITVARRCPGRYGNVTCALTNVGLVTGEPGTPTGGGLGSDWRCAQCNRHLAKVHPVKGGITVRCRCGAKVGVTAAHAIRASQPLARAS